MSLTIALREEGGIAVLDLAGILVYGKKGDSLREHVAKLIEAHQTKIILNLEGLTYCDSYGLGCLTSAFVSSRNAGVTLKLVNPGKRVEEVLQVTRLHTVIDILPGVAEAAASFR